MEDDLQSKIDHAATLHRDQLLKLRYQMAMNQNPHSYVPVMNDNKLEAIMFLDGDDE